mgnify:CR=1 FL=1
MYQSLYIIKMQTQKSLLDYFNIEKYIKPLNRNNQQYGWYVYIDRVKADFGGVHIPLNESKLSAIEFIQNLKNWTITY